jgi:hypothetical protein
LEKGRKEATVAYSELLFQYTPGGVEENHEKPHSVKTVSEPRVEARTSLM